MKTLLITGASRGIGAATAMKAAKHGYRVAINYHASADAAQSVAKTIQDGGGEALLIGSDVSTDAGVTQMFAELDAAYGPPDALFNNAGIIHPNMLIEDTDAATLERLWQVNISSQFLVARETVKRMSTRHGGKGGAIVNMSSAAAVLGGGGGLLAYAASKAANDTFTTGLANEVAAQGIRVNAVRPGLIETTIHDDTGDLERLKKLVSVVPMGRTGSAEEVADVVLYLLSDAASYVTGTHVAVGG
ncbi:MAG: SDR family oxidoreductase, partial [Pseudomonadota bacterium]